MHEEIIRYIASARDYGLNSTEIKQHLLVAGWDEAEIDQALKAASENFPIRPAIEVKTHIIEASRKVSELPPSLRKKSSLKKILLISGLVITVLGCSAYLLVFRNVSVMGYSVFSLIVSRIQNDPQATNKKDFEFSYKDPESFSSSALGSELGAFTLKTLEFKIKNSNLRDANNSREGETDLNFVNNNETYAAQVEYKYLKGDLYFKLSENGQNTFLSDFANKSLGPNIIGNWLKIKVGENATEGVDIKNKVNFSSIIKNLLSNHALSPKLLGLENINGHYALHYQININKDALTKIVMDQLPSNDSAPSQMVSNQDKETVQSVLNNLQIPSAEIWIGLRDLALKKIYVSSNAPSLASAAELSIANYTQGLAINNDNQRLSDSRQIASALELFYNDNKGYPEGLTGVPQNMFPKYLPAIPAVPAASGNCSDFYNAYWYKHQGEPKTSAKGFKVYPSYTLTFCLGNDVANLKAGLAIMSPSGITTTVACADPVHPCFLEKSRQNSNPESVPNLISKLKFTGNLSWTYTPDNIKNVNTVTVPENALDLGGALGGQLQPN